MRKPEEIASRLLGIPYKDLDDRTKHVTQHVADRSHIARDVRAEGNADITFGQRAAGAVATFGGSWTFVRPFAAVTLLHEKLDHLREKQWEGLLELQREQLKQLASLLGSKIGSA